MDTTHAANIEVIKAEILAQLNFDPKHPPIHVNDKTAAVVLGVQANTLACWRTAGRYSLPYLKIGRKVQYRLNDLAEFLARRTTSHTGEAK